MESIIDFQEKFGNVIISSSMDINKMHISVQTEFMKRVLIDESNILGRNIGGITTDATFKYFSKRIIKIYSTVVQSQ